MCLNAFAVNVKYRQFLSFYEIVRPNLASELFLCPAIFDYFKNTATTLPLQETSRYLLALSADGSCFR